MTRRPNATRRSDAEFPEVAAADGASNGIAAGSHVDDELDLEAGISMFVPPWCLIMAALSRNSERVSTGDDIAVPRKLLQFLIRCLLEQTDFDEKQYRECNPDVAEAIRQRVFISGRDHFTKVGYFEDRKGGTSVHEIWYLARNPDVAAAKQSGAIESGEKQYRLAGAHEWREPSPEAVKWIRAWKDALDSNQ